MNSYVCVCMFFLSMVRSDAIGEGQVREKDKEEDRWNQVGKRGGQVESGRKRS